LQHFKQLNRRPAAMGLLGGERKNMTGKVSFVSRFGLAGKETLGNMDMGYGFGGGFDSIRRTPHLTNRERYGIIMSESKIYRENMLGGSSNVD
jgi:hypothetical protein